MTGIRLPSPAALDRKLAFVRLDMARQCRLAYAGVSGRSSLILQDRDPIFKGQHQCLWSARAWLRGVESASVADARARQRGFRLPG